jgi:hypothetical protein
MGSASQENKHPLNLDRHRYFSYSIPNRWERRPIVAFLKAIVHLSLLFLPVPSGTWITLFPLPFSC